MLFRDSRRPIFDSNLTLHASQSPDLDSLLFCVGARASWLSSYVPLTSPPNDDQFPDACTQEFEAAYLKLRQWLCRDATPWPECSRIPSFRVEHAAAIAEALDFPAADPLQAGTLALDHLQGVMTRRGFTLLINNLPEDEEPLTLLLFPTTDKHRILRKLCTCYEENRALLHALRRFEKTFPFQLVAAGSSFLSGCLTTTPSIQGAREAASMLRQICPDLKECQTLAEVAADLESTGEFFLIWA